ncbi:MAG: hypothetical protein WC465_03125 [Patescibacteria group bacterium]
MEEEYKKENEEPISKELGYPYNVLPKGYPDKISDEKINEAIQKFFGHLKGNAGVSSSILQDTAFINIGLNELNNRKNNKQTKIAFRISLASIIIALFAMFFAYAQYQVALNQIEEQRNANSLTKSMWEYEKMRNDRLEAREIEWRREDINK